MANLATTKLSIMVFTLFSILFMSCYAGGPDPVLHSETEHSFDHMHNNREVLSGPNPIHYRMVAPIYSNSARVLTNINKRTPGGPDPIHNPPNGYDSNINRGSPGGPDPIHNPIHNPPVVTSTDSNSCRGSSINRGSPGKPDPIRHPPKGFSTLDMSINKDVPGGPDPIHNNKAYILD
ncbi:hypothetical protein FNV43_RR13718 [Rhamnella rubrinervis]|uniref:Uncharacterized protein n=1 Tax=Rhamnella rubrinervis TaxID=2594499 RepID=A0A8K0H1W3_9ROSA|nr:hypothetical protein FNV43_RR13718 [Rhamnella rubrinervis]